MSNWAAVIPHPAALDSYSSYLVNSALVSIFWVSVGKAISDFESRRARKTSADAAAMSARKVLWAFSAIGAAALFIENVIVTSLGPAPSVNDCYFSLPMLCVPVFLLLLGADIHISHAKTMRAMSTVIYCAHGTYCNLIADLWKGITLHGMPKSALYLVTIAACMVTCTLMLHLEQYRAFRWMRWGH